MLPAMPQAEKAAVREYWEAQPCGSDAAAAEWATRPFFDEIEEHRYTAEPFVCRFAEFQQWSGKRILEIGVGSGTDFVNFARAGAVASGVDLTEQGVALTRRRLELEGLEGDVRVADAENLPFDDGTFDLVYSWGVLHHTPDTEKAIGEVRRILKPDGEARIMLYARYSWTGFRIWVRHALLRGRPFRSLSWVWAHHMESVGTKAYTRREAERLFQAFADVRIVRYRTPYDEAGWGPIARLTRSRLGCFMGIVARPS